MPGPNSVGGAVDGRGTNLHQLGEKYAFSTPGPRRKTPGPVPETVFHYTDAAGLFGIITSGELRFTDTRFLNDVSEGEYARTTIVRTLQRLEIPADPFVKQVVANLAEMFEAPPDASYVACFCESEKLLSQWRAYGRGGAGFNIGLNIRNDELLTDRAQSCRLRCIEYDATAKIEGAVKDIRQLLSPYADRPGPISDPEKVATTIRTLTGWMASLVSTYKNPVFKEEKEWRLTSSGTGLKVQFRHTSSSIIPYVAISEPLNLGPRGSSNSHASSITQVTCGPAVSREVSDVSLPALLKSVGLGHVQVARADDIPLRRQEF
jgi:hypothetical protein